MEFNPFLTDPHFNPSKHNKSQMRQRDPGEMLDEGKYYEIEIMGEGKRSAEVRGFFSDESVGIDQVLLLPKGASCAEEYEIREILSVKEILKDTAW